LIRAYITDRTALGGIAPLLDNIARNAREGIDYIQLREKDLSGRELFDLTREALLRIGSTGTKLLVNDRADIAMAAGAHGVHLRSNSLPAREWRRVLPPDFLIGVSCHTLEDIEEAESADFVVYGPVFETPGKGPPVGLAGLADAVKHTSIPVLALGGIANRNKHLCLEAGAAGIAAIRLFQQ
jgi:thiamine-phosphate pyrophosphorylase